MSSGVECIVFRGVSLVLAWTFVQAPDFDKTFSTY